MNLIIVNMKIGKARRNFDLLTIGVKKKLKWKFLSEIET